MVDTPPRDVRVIASDLGNLLDAYVKDHPLPLQFTVVDTVQTLGEFPTFDFAIEAAPVVQPKSRYDVPHEQVGYSIVETYGQNRVPFLVVRDGSGWTSSTPYPRLLEGLYRRVQHGLCALVPQG